MNINELKLGSLTIQGASDILKTFDSNFMSLGISSLDSNGWPTSSYAAFLKENDKYYILLSQTAPHYDNIVNNKNIGIIFLEDESKSLNTFFRKRLTYSCTASLIDDNNIKSLFTKKHGKLSEMLINTMDFNIFELVIIEGKLVLGAGKAYFINENNSIIKHDTGKSSHFKN